MRATPKALGDRHAFRYRYTNGDLWYVCIDLYIYWNAMFPRSFFASGHSAEIPMSLDLSRCSVLQTLHVYLARESITDERLLGMLDSMLDSWRADVRVQNVHLGAYNEHEFTRQAFADLLRTMTQALERWTHSSPTLPRTDGEASEQRMERGVFVDLYDWEVWQDWWRMQIKECFPTYAKSGRLHMSYGPRECSSSFSTPISDFPVTLR